MDRQEIEATLREVAEAHGARLVVEQRRPTLRPIPLSDGAGGYLEGRCPNCGNRLFWHEFGDMFCRCGGCGAEVDVDDLEAEWTL